MINYTDWLFFGPAILAVFFMIWVLFKFTEQLAAPKKAQKAAETEPRYLRIVTAAAQKERQISTRTY